MNRKLDWFRNINERWYGMNLSLQADLNPTWPYSQYYAQGQPRSLYLRVCAWCEHTVKWVLVSIALRIDKCRIVVPVN